METAESGAHYIREQYSQNMKLKQIFDENHHLFQQQIIASTTPYLPHNIITKIKNGGASEIYVCSASSITHELLE